jgi:TetR/AcrR family transcriptional regulator, copper-responsive repressor
MTVFWEQGLASTSLDDLALAMGMNRPSIYNAFGNKEQIYRLALQNFAAQLDEALHTALQTPAGLQAGLMMFYEQALDLYCGHTPPLGCLVMCTAPAAAVTHPQIKEDLAQLLARVDDQLHTAIKRAIANGELVQVGDARSAAKLLQGLLHTLALRARAGESKISLVKLAKYGVTMVLGRVARTN